MVSSKKRRVSEVLIMGFLPPNRKPPTNRPNTATMDFTDEPVVDMIPSETARRSASENLRVNRFVYVDNRPSFLRRIIILGVITWIVIIAVIVALIVIF
jgi:hypothetical protein